MPLLKQNIYTVFSVKDHFYSIIKNFIQVFIGYCCGRSWKVLKSDIYSNINTGNCTAGYNDLVHKWIMAFILIKSPD